MPNWIEGSLKLRGKPDDILRFFEEGLNVYTYGKDGSDIPLEKSSWLRIEEFDDGKEIEIEFNTSSWIHVNNTRRAFINDPGFAVWFQKPKDDIDIIVAIPICQAWGFDVDNWIYIAKQFTLDLRLYGIECGMGFSEEVIINRDGVIETDLTQDYKDYDDFRWNCPFPWMGG